MTKVEALQLEPMCLVTYQGRRMHVWSYDMALDKVWLGELTAEALRLINEREAARASIQNSDLNDDEKAAKLAEFPALDPNAPWTKAYLPEISGPIEPFSR